MTKQPCFIFTNSLDAEAVEWLLWQPHLIADLLRRAREHAAEALTDETLQLDDDCLCNDDERVYVRLAELLRAHVVRRLDAVLEVLAEHDDVRQDGEADLYARAMMTGLEQINWQCVARAIYFGVDPALDPSLLPIPEML